MHTACQSAISDESKWSTARACTKGDAFTWWVAYGHFGFNDHSSLHGVFTDMLIGDTDGSHRLFVLRKVAASSESER